MVPRLQFDISWRELARVASDCAWPPAGLALPLCTAAASEAMVALSVRSSFDLLLAALDLPKGSEVLLSEITVPHMLSIVREHGLVPIGVPVDPRTLHVDAADVAARLSPQTKVIVIAHLFGARAPLEAIGQLARERSILLVEDAAQALVRGNLQRDPAADVSLFSFGPIKTATALGGGVALVADQAVLERMQQTAASWPCQSSWEFFWTRVFKIGLLKFLSTPTVLSVLVAAVKLLGGDADKFVGGSARGFADDQLFAKLRKQPCAALRQTIARRLSRFDQTRIAKRTRCGQQLMHRIATWSDAFVAGCDNPSHSFWVLPLVCQQPALVVAQLRAAGFDASQVSGLTVVDNAKQDPSGHWFRRTVFVPQGCHLTDRQRERIVQAVGVMPA